MEVIAAIIGALAIIVAALITRGCSKTVNPSVVQTPDKEQNTAVAVPDQELESQLRDDPRVKRLLGNKSWELTAEAAIAELTRETLCEVPGWRRTSTWQQVEAAWSDLTGGNIEV